jgi:magnesium transporter
MSALSDVAKKLTYRSTERIEILRNLELVERSAVFDQLSPYVQQSILKDLRESEIVEMLDNMDMPHAERALARIRNVKKRKRIAQRLKGEVKEKTEYFLRFHPQASLSLINFNYLFLPQTLTIAEAADIIDSHYEETGKYPELLVHNDGELVGEVLFSTLVRERKQNKLRRFVEPVTTIPYHSAVSTIIDTIVGTKTKKLVVIDRDGSVLGVIYADNVKSLFGSLPAETLYDFAGVDDSERPMDSIATKVKNRYRWLILNLATSFLAGFMVLLFQDTLDALTILAVYIPIVAGMGGNAATQSFAIMVRGLTLGTVALEGSRPVVAKEMVAGIINGLIIGSIVAVVSTVWNGSPMLGVVVGLTLVCSHTIAAIAGTIIPLVMKHLGKDPAATSTIFITTVTDVLGLLFLLGFATLILL